MTLLNPRNVDVADLLALIRDISDRLDSIDDHIDDLDGQLGGISDDIDTMKVVLAHEPGHDRGVASAVTAVIADLTDRHSLIPVNDDDEYEDGCPSCLLRKNGYPRLAAVLGNTDDGEED